MQRDSGTSKQASTSARSVNASDIRKKKNPFHNPHKSTQARSYTYRCLFCDAIFTTRSELHIHKARFHKRQYGGFDLQDAPFEQDGRHFDAYPNADEMHALYQDNEMYILEPHQLDDPLFKAFNYPLAGTVTNGDIEKQMRDIYVSTETSKAYKLEMCAGVILKNTENNSLRYFKPEANAYLLDLPLLIENQESLEASIRYIQSLELDDYIRSFRPNTKYQVIYITQLVYHCWLTDFPLGAKKSARHLPDFIKKSHAIETSVIVEGYENCCLFICLAQYFKQKGQIKNCIREMKSLLTQWFNYCLQNKITEYPICTPAAFEGVQWRHLGDVEKCFNVALCIMQLEEDGTSSTQYISLSKSPNIVYLNIYENHLNLVTSMQQYSKRYRCFHCSILFKKRSYLLRHQASCGRMTKYICPTASYKFHKTVFEQLEEFGIVVSKEDQFYPYFAVFDLEALLERCSIVSPSGQTKFYNQHKPISCSIASNCEGFTEPYCIIEANSDKLIEQMLTYLQSVRKVAVQKSLQKWGGALKELEDKLHQRRWQLKMLFDEQQERQKQRSVRERHRVEDEIEVVRAEDVEDLEGGSSSKKHNILMKYFMRDPMFSMLLRLYRKFYLYVHNFIVLSFNGQKYDIHLIRSSLIKRLKEIENGSRIIPMSRREMLDCSSDCGSDCDESGDESEDESEDEDMYFDEEEELLEILGEGGERPGREECSLKYILNELKLYEAGKMKVLKRTNKYASLGNQHFTLLDICNWLGPGTNYRKFLRAYSVTEEKLWFPYEYLTSFEKLEEPIPPYPSDSWRSTLRGEGKGMDILAEEYEEWKSNGCKGKAPPTGEENYAHLLQVCKKHNVQTLRGLLRIYNNMDVGPFAIAASNMQQEYFSQNLDIWKDSIGIPGLARIQMMKFARENSIIFPLFDRDNMDLYFLFRRMSVGGPAIVHTRRAKVGETALRADGEFLCNALEAYDCNSMYLSVLRNSMPTTMYVRRFAENQFRPQYKRNYFKMQVWLKMVGESRQQFVRSRATSGEECRAFGYYLDGLIVEEDGSLTALEFAGCHFHQHSAIDSSCWLDKSGGVTPDAYAKFEEKIKKLESHGYKVEVMWECCFDETMKLNSDLQKQLHEMKPPFLRKFPQKATERQILQATEQGLFFGFLLVDIHTPEDVKERLNVLPPIFSNHELQFEDFGEIMKEYMKKNDSIIKSRKLLLSGYAAQEILLSSRLVSYYLKLGLVVTKLHQVIEFTPAYPFKSFVETVTHHRLEATKNPDRKIIGEIHKLIGNSAYGSTMLDKMKYTSTEYVSGDHEARLKINSKYFKSMSPLCDDVYEFQMGHRSLRLDIPVYLATQILMDAKLSLLSFVYDFILYFIPIKHFEIMSMDTDSIYGSFHGKSLEDSVRPELKNEFQHRRKDFCKKERHPEAVLPRTCCADCQFIDEKFPALWKCENVATEIIALASKTYVCYNENDENIKMSCKGINKQAAMNNQPLERFREVLNSRVPHGGTNRGFRVVGTHMFTYRCERKTAFPWVYLKRDVFTECGIYTRALNVLLNPCPKYYFCLQTDAPRLGPDYELAFVYREYVVKTIRQAHCLEKYLYVTKVRQPPMDSSIRLFSLILRTTEAVELVRIENKIMQECKEFQRDEYDILFNISCAKFSRHPDLVRDLMKSEKQYIVNACHLDDRTGTGVNAHLCRWEKEAHLCGMNLLGKTLMTLRTVKL